MSTAKFVIAKRIAKRKAGYIKQAHERIDTLRIGIFPVGVERKKRLKDILSELKDMATDNADALYAKYDELYKDQ